MLKFAVLCFLVIMASTSAEQCGDQVCGAGTCCAEYPESTAKELDSYMISVWMLKPPRTQEITYFFVPCDEGMYCDMNSWSCQKKTAG
uniref:U25-Hexatoxin-Hc1be_1 n=1 Tax=Hadronyche cerberea TaxID=1107879 RepID=A0A4Q8K6W3_HADCE